MRKKYFDTKLYGNGLKQLRVSGIIIMILSLLGTALPALLMLLNNKQQQALGNAAFYSSVSDMTVLLGFIMFLAPIVMCLVLFSFLNTRKGSDFYHSLPNNRFSVFFSFAAAILTWVFAAVILSLLVTSLFYIAFGAPFNAAILPCVLFTYIVGATLITAALLLAMSVTGTFITNISVFGLILFLPRLLSTLFSYVLTSNLKIITMHQFGIFFDPNFNIPVKNLPFVYAVYTIFEYVPRGRHRRCCIYLRRVDTLYLDSGGGLLRACGFSF